MKTYTFSIPKPCTASWQEMPPMTQGRYCQTCEKVVVDCSQMTDKEVIAYFEKNGNCCGKFAVGQLNREIANRYDSVVKKRVFFPAAMLAAFLAAVTPGRLKAQGNVKTEENGNLITSVPIQTNDTLPCREISGVVRDSAGEIIPFVNIILKSNNESRNFIIRNQTDEKGAFKIAIQDANDANLILIVSCIGYLTKEVAITEITQHVKVVLTPYDTDQQNYLIGAYTTVRRSGLRNWIHRMFN